MVALIWSKRADTQVCPYISVVGFVLIGSELNLDFLVASIDFKGDGSISLLRSNPAKGLEIGGLGAIDADNDVVLPQSFFV